MKLNVNDSVAAPDIVSTLLKICRQKECGPAKTSADSDGISQLADAVGRLKLTALNKAGYSIKVRRSLYGMTAEERTIERNVVLSVLPNKKELSMALVSAVGQQCSDMGLRLPQLTERRAAFNALTVSNKIALQLGTFLLLLEQCIG